MRVKVYANKAPWKQEAHLEQGFCTRYQQATVRAGPPSIDATVIVTRKVGAISDDTTKPGNDAPAGR